MHRSMRFRKIYKISPLSAPSSWKTPGTIWSFLLPIMASLALGPWLCENSDWVQKKELTLLMKVLPIYPWAIYPWDPIREVGLAKVQGEEQEQEGRVQEVGIKRPGMSGSGQCGCVDLRAWVEGETGKAGPLAMFSSCLSCLCILFSVMSFKEL